MKKIIIIGVCTLIIIGIFVSATIFIKTKEKPVDNIEETQQVTVIVTEEEVVVEQPTETSLPQEEEKFVDQNEYTILELLELIEEQQQQKEKIHQLATLARELGFVDNDEIILNFKEEYNFLNEKEEFYQEQLNNNPFGVKMIEYPEATTVWLHLQNLGYNNYACAGIIGNMMAECGGEGLTLKTWAYNPNENGGGLCGWLYSYTPNNVRMHEQSLEYQLNYLTGETRGGIAVQFERYAYYYKSGFNLEQFKNIDNCRDAAIAFAKIYEKCDSSSYTKRQNNAELVYDYFVNN